MDKKKATPGASIQRSLVVRYAKRIQKKLGNSNSNWERGKWQAMQDLIEWLKGQAVRTNKKKGGLGRR